VHAPSRRLIALVAAAMTVVACSAGSSPRPVRSPDRVIFNPEPTSGPYVVVAVDNHFHDIHPVDDPRIHSDQPFVVKNEGRNLHNFTVVGTKISIDLRPGRRFEWNPIGSRLAPGSYTVFCKYHSYAGMTGAFVVTK
jgi:hypothetical protein